LNLLAAIKIRGCQLPVPSIKLFGIKLFGCLEASEARIMPQKRLPEASDKLRGRAADVVELTSEPEMGPPGNTRHQRASQAAFDPSAPLAKDTISTFVYELSQRLTAIVNSLGATRRLFAAGNQMDLQTARHVVDEAAEQARLATETIRQFRQASLRHASDARTKATTIRQAPSGKVERSRR
jgi:hypothetical protein